MHNGVLKRRTQDLCVQFCCTKCLEWQSESGFVKRPLRNGRTIGYGLEAICKICRNENSRIWRINNPHKVKIAARKSTTAKSAKTKLLRRSSIHRLDAGILRNAIEENRQLSYDKIAELSRISEKTIYNIKNGIQKTVNYYDADRILVTLGLQWLLAEMNPCIDFRWSRKHDCCTSCETTNFVHHGHGLCSRCYQNPDSSRPLDSLWSVYYRHCQDGNCCYTVNGNTSKRHYGHGLCTSCYKKNWKKKKRGEASLLKDAT